MENYSRFVRDVQYDLLIPPLGLNINSFTAKQAKENFQWVISQVPERVKYLVQRCASDLDMPTDKFNYSQESLIWIWKWFLKTAKLEKTPKDVLESMQQQANIFGESFLNKEQFSVATTFIMRDIAMYVGQMFVTNYSQLYWNYFTKPKSSVDVNYPIISGFKTVYMGKEGELYFQPFRMVGVQAANLFDKTYTVNDLFNIYNKWLDYIPSSD